MKHYDRLRWSAVALLAAAAVLSFAGNAQRSPILRALALAFFLAAVFSFMGFRRATRTARARVFDREAKTPDETGPSPDQ